MKRIGTTHFIKANEHKDGVIDTTTSYWSYDHDMYGSMVREYRAPPGAAAQRKKHMRSVGFGGLKAEQVAHTYGCQWAKGNNTPLKCTLMACIFVYVQEKFMAKVKQH
jgi:uncharacterized membrane protein YbaN (DUF454 family)